MIADHNMNSDELRNVPFWVIGDVFTFKYGMNGRAVGFCKLEEWLYPNLSRKHFDYSEETGSPYDVADKIVMEKIRV